MFTEKKKTAAANSNNKNIYATFPKTKTVGEFERSTKRSQMLKKIKPIGRKNREIENTSPDENTKV